jgi:hypothetical protein
VRTKMLHLPCDNKSKQSPDVARQRERGLTSSSPKIEITCCRTRSSKCPTHAARLFLKASAWFGPEGLSRTQGQVGPSLRAAPGERPPLTVLSPAVARGRVRVTMCPAPFRFPGTPCRRSSRRSAGELGRGQVARLLRPKVR